MDINTLIRMGACQPAIDFVSHQKSWQAAWEDKNCSSKDQEQHFEWRLWLLTKLAGDTKEAWNNIGHRKLVAFFVDLYLTSQKNVDKIHREVLDQAEAYGKGEVFPILVKPVAPSLPSKSASPKELSVHAQEMHEYRNRLGEYELYVKRCLFETEELAQVSVRASSKAVYMIGQYATGGMKDAPRASAFATFCDIMAEQQSFPDHVYFFAHANRLVLKHYPTGDI